MKLQNRLVAASVALALCVVTAGNVAGTPAAAGASASASPLRQFYAQKLVWSKCPNFPNVKCTWVRVPLDYAKPGGITIKIRLADRPANISKGKAGVLFTNPGGPGGWGTYDAFAAIDAYSPTLVDHYDIVGFDPRGIGASTHIGCINTPLMDTAFGFGANGVNQTPTTPEDMTALNSAFTALGASCAANAPNLIKHLSTIEVARDMDIMRALLHQKTLTYMGASYGTYLGAWYAQLFPKRVGRFVLDGAIDPAVPAQQGWVDFAGGMELALHRFLADCPKHPVDCPSQLNGTASQNYATFENLVATITQTPVVVPGLEPLTRVRLMLGIASWLYDDAVGWERLRQALTSLWTSNDGRLFDENAYWWYGKDSATNSYDPSALQQDAILCLDRPSLPALADPNNQALAEAATVAPDFGDVFLWHEQICGNWPVQGSRPSSPLHAIGSPTIVVVGNKYDPATPYKHAVSLAKQLQHARLLTWIGDGHTAYNRGSNCIDYAIDTFLVKGILPKVGKVCPAVPRA